MKIITLGRAPDNDIVIEDQKVSAKHLALNLNDSGEYFVQDLGSTNGTLVNNLTLGNTPHKITPGDQIKIGDTVLPWLDYFTSPPKNTSENEPDQAETTSSQDSSYSSESLEQLRRSRRLNDHLQKNRILWVGLIALFVIFAGLLTIWYFNNVVAPELGSKQSKFPAFTKAVICPINPVKENQYNILNANFPHPVKDILG